MRPVLVVDGTNVSWAWPRCRPLMLQGRFAEAQALLLTFTSRSRLMAEHEELVLVFDGPPPRGGPAGQARAAVLYPDPGHSADDRIVDLVGVRRHRGAPVVLVSSDRALRDAVRRLGATTMGALQLITAIDPRPEPSPSGGGGRPEKPAPSGRDTAEWLHRFSAHRRRPQKEGDSR